MKIQATHIRRPDGVSIHTLSISLTTARPAGVNLHLPTIEQELVDKVIEALLGLDTEMIDRTTLRIHATE